jgi:hypothetical protein
MRKTTLAAILVGFLLAQAATAQETPIASPAPTPSATESPILSSAPSPTTAAIATPPMMRNARISFLPPPMEGKISLGIYDTNSRLVRVLHKEAELDEFTVGENALVTKWDGKSDNGEDLPAGKYNARGYLVGHLKVEDLGKGGSPSPDPNAAATASVKLTSNPLAKETKAMVDLAVGLNDGKIYLKTTDGLPLFTIGPATNATEASIIKSGEKSIDVLQNDGAGVAQFRVSNIDKMMAFDCGDFELK